MPMGKDEAREAADLRLALRESEARFDKVFQASPSAIAISTVEDGRHYEVNEAWLRIFGFRRDEVIGKTVAELDAWPSPGDRARFIAEFLRQDRSIRNYKARLYNKARELRTFLVSGEEVEYDGALRLLLVFHDITELEQNRLSTEALNRLLRTVSGVESMLVHTDRRETLLHEACRILVEEGEYPLVCISMRPAQDAPADGAWRTVMARRDVHGQTLLSEAVGCAENCSLIRAVAEGGHACFIDGLAGRKDIRSCPQIGRPDGMAAVSAYPISAGSEAGVLSVYTDGGAMLGDEARQLLASLSETLGYALEKLANVEALLAAEERLRLAHVELERRVEARPRELRIENEERRRAEAEVRDRATLYRTILATTGEGFWRLDADGVTVEVNNSLCDMLGCGPGDIAGRSPLDFVPPERRDELARNIGARERQDYREYECEYLRQDGRRILAAIHANTLRDESGKVLGSFAFIQDISELKRVQAEERAAREAAESANRAKSEFLSLMSHELRTPLNAVLGFAQLMQFDPQHPLLPAQLDSVVEIMRAGNHLLGLINEILELSRIETGRLALTIAEVKVGPLIDESLNMVREAAHKRRVDLIDEATTPCEGMAFLADHSRLRQVLLNLLSNAVKYNREGGWIRIACSEMAPGRLRIEVEDSGLGIPAARRGELFRPFSRLGRELSGIEGTGIGLAITRRLVEAMEGEIGFDSEEGAGSRFWVELPLAPASAGAKG